MSGNEKWPRSLENEDEDEDDDGKGREIKKGRGRTAETATVPIMGWRAALRGEWNGEIEFVMKRESSVEISCLFGVSAGRDEVIFPL